MATLPLYGDFDLTKHQLMNAVLQLLGSDPGSPVEGQLYYHSGNHAVMYHNGTAFVALQAGAGYTDEQVRDVIAAAIQDSSTIDFTDTDASNTMQLVVIDDSITNAKAANMPANTVKANITGSAADPTDTTLVNFKAWLALAAADISNLATVVKAYRLDEFADPNSDIPMAGQKFTGVGSGVADTDFATMGQLNAAVSGQKWKAPVRLMTQSNDTLSGLAARDGVTPLAGERVLVPNQTSHAADGIYLAAAGAWSRAADADSATELNDATVLVEEGTASAGDIYTQTATIATLGTTAQVWQKVGEGNAVYAADGTLIELTGNTFRIAATAAGSGLGGGGAGGALVVNTGTGLEISSDAVRIAAAAAGAGLTGGAGVALAVGQGTGIIVNTDDVAIDPAVVVRKYATDYGNGALTDVTITHNLNTLDIEVTIIRKSDSQVVLVPWKPATVNTATIQHDVAPTTNQFRAVVQA